MLNLQDSKLILLKDTKALIVGASRGLGKTILETFKDRGASVVGSSSSGKNNTLKSDVQEKASAKTSVRDARVLMDGLNTLVYSAGIYGPIGKVEDINWDEWMNTISVNLYGAVNMCRHALPTFIAQKKGKIIILSGGGATKPMPNFSAYAASKAAVVRFAETLAEEVKEHNIQVNCVSPGSLNTDFMETAIAAGPESAGQEFYNRMVKQKQEGGDSIQNAADLVAYLASEESNHISGKLISAVWDDWRNLKDIKPDMYTLRRIDKDSML